VTENSTRALGRRRAIIAGAAGVALLIGGSTYALWSSSAQQAGGVIKSGDLKVAAVGSVQAFDVSQDRKDSTPGSANVVDIVTNASLADAASTAKTMSGHLIELGADETAAAADTAWKIVPGDTAALTFDYTVTLIGDNLVADLRVAEDMTALAAKNGISFTYAVYNAETGAQYTSAPGSLTPGAKIATFASADIDLGRGVVDESGTAVISVAKTDPVAPSKTAKHTADVTVVVYAKFAAGSDTTADTNTVTESAAYVNTLTDVASTMKVQLDQNRSGVGQFK
jgi:predicted ribosomally synthesized peptide with SipW-like signal peptide